MVNTIPQWLSSYLRLEETQAIEQSVQEAEKLTSAEIVPMLVYRSTSSRMSSPFLGLIFVLLALLGKHTLTVYASLSPSSLLWSFYYPIAFVLGFALAKLPSIERYLIPRLDQKEECERRAMLSFYQQGLTGTQGRNGVLLFVSFFERRAVILADQAIASHCPPGTFDHLVKQLVVAAKERKLQQGFSQTILDLAGMMREKFPARPNEKNELKDSLRIEF